MDDNFAVRLLAVIGDLEVGEPGVGLGGWFVQASELISYVFLPGVV